MNISLPKKGFTLIEILVVVSIIGILSAVLYANFNDARQEARNKSMQAELKNVQLALELYKAQNNRYPDTASIGNPCNGTSFGVSWAVSSGCGTTPFISGVVPEFIAELPLHTDSKNSSCEIRYQVESANGEWYKLTAENCLEGAANASEGVQPGDEFARCLSSCGASCNTTYTNSSPFYESYAIYSAGGECE